MALTWWTNTNKHQDGKSSHFNINNNKWLKEFIIDNPPTFKISQLCCKGAKKEPSKNYIKDNKIDLKIIGVRNAEGGIRATAYKSCFDENKNEYRPIFWFTDKDKLEYEKIHNIIHSKCYTEYGFKRTGCMGCPFNSRWQEDLEKIKDKEPMLYKAVNNIFKDSYEYSLAYKRYKENKQRNEINGQIVIEDLIKENKND